MSIKKLRNLYLIEGTGKACTEAIKTMSVPWGSSNWELFEFDAKTGALRPTGSEDKFLELNFWISTKRDAKKILKREKKTQKIAPIWW